MADNSQVFDAKAFRNALGEFPTGVTIITTQAFDGTNIGMTANSFNSVSLEPPLVLWSIAKNSKCLPAFLESNEWAVHILAANQTDLSTRFATSGLDKFAGVELETPSIEGFRPPVIRGCVGHFLCRTRYQYEGGDHLIFVGDVLAFHHDPKRPLAFHAGKYALTAEKTEIKLQEARNDSALFHEDNLGFLLGKAYYSLYAKINAGVRQAGLTPLEFYVGALLSLHPKLSETQIQQAMTPFEWVDLVDALQSLQNKQWVSCSNQSAAEYGLTDKGRELMIQLIHTEKQIEAAWLAQIDVNDEWLIKQLLKKIILLQATGQEHLWG